MRRRLAFAMDRDMSGNYGQNARKGFHVISEWLTIYPLDTGNDNIGNYFQVFHSSISVGTALFHHNPVYRKKTTPISEIFPNPGYCFFICSFETKRHYITTPLFSRIGARPLS
jgi:hypothetical protein